jgi:hypothetical protein
MISLKRPPALTTSPTRGRWCNLCGSRLAVQSSIGRGLPYLASLPYPPRLLSQRKVEWRVPSKETSTWALCTQCYEERLCCASCNTRVGDQVIVLRGGSQIYCPTCFEQRPHCDTCARPVGSRYWTHKHGRKLCDDCQSTSVTQATHAHTLYRRVRAGLLHALGMRLREPCQLKMAGRRQMLHLIEKSTLHSLDADSRGRCFGLFLREGKHRAIFVEYGLPQIVLLEVMAHEYAHAWQSERCSPDLSPELQEGFAEWVAFKLLQHWGCRNRTARMLRRDDLYGRGLQMMLGWERKGGVAEVFRRVTGHD